MSVDVGGPGSAQLIDCGMRRWVLLEDIPSTAVDHNGEDHLRWITGPSLERLVKRFGFRLKVVHSEQSRVTRGDARQVNGSGYLEPLRNGGPVEDHRNLRNVAPRIGGGCVHPRRFRLQGREIPVAGKIAVRLRH